MWAEEGNHAPDPCEERQGKLTRSSSTWRFAVFPAVSLAIDPRLSATQDCGGGNREIAGVLAAGSGRGRGGRTEARPDSPFGPPQGARSRVSDGSGLLRTEIPGPGYHRRLVSCQVACPVHTDARGYVRAIAEGRFEEAYLIARGPNPFASICGRICGAPCEAACRRGRIPRVDDDGRYVGDDRPIAIRALKRFACERFGVDARPPEEVLGVGSILRPGGLRRRRGDGGAAPGVGSRCGSSRSTGRRSRSSAPAPPGCPRLTIWR